MLARRAIDILGLALILVISAFPNATWRIPYLTTDPSEL